MVKVKNGISLILSLSSTIAIPLTTSPISPPLTPPQSPTRLLPYHAAGPGASPLHQFQEPPIPMSLKELEEKMKGRNKGNGKRQVNSNVACLDSSATDDIINTLFNLNGANFRVILCPNAIIKITNNPIYFTAAGQELSTQGYPQGSTRATLILSSVNLTTVIYGANDDNIKLKNVIINGNRPGLGWDPNGNALIEMGGNSVGQIIDSVWAYEARSWSCLHGIEGYNNQCRGMRITNNQIGPSGHAPNTGLQFKKRDSTGNYNPGQWADGISIACPQSIVTGNTITDATDGMIVCFTCQSLISGNTLISSDRQALGGINLVDFGPNAGNYTGTVVSNNNIISQSNFIKVGIAVGTMTWGTDNRTLSRTYGATISGNTLSSGPNGYFGFGISVGGHNSVSLSGNTVATANFGGEPSNVCFTGIGLPKSQAFVIDPTNTPGSTSQSEFVKATVAFFICQEPGAIIATGLTPTPPPSNTFSSTTVPANDLALSSTVTCSTESVGQPCIAAIDGKIGGYTGGSNSYPSQEWSSAGQNTNAWISLSWTSPVTISQVILYDRPNLNDHITAGQLKFPDGSIIFVPALNNDGTGISVSIPNITTTGFTFTVLQTSSTTQNSGLAVIVVLGLGSGQVTSSSSMVSSSVISSTQLTSSVIASTAISSFTPSTSSVLSTTTSSVAPSAILSSAIITPVSTSSSSSSIPISTSPAVISSIVPVTSQSTILSSSVTSPATLSFVSLRTSSVSLSSSIPTTIVSTSPVPSPTLAFGSSLLFSTPAINLAISAATVRTVSALSTSPGLNAIDGNLATSWISNGGGVGTWIMIKWSSKQTFNQVVIAQSTGPTIMMSILYFSDGTSIKIGATKLGNQLTPFSFPSKTSSWIIMSVNSIQPSTGSAGGIGLSEFQVYNQ